MDRDSERIRTVGRRALLLGGLKLGVFGALAARMYYLQVTESERFKVLAEENRINMRLMAPSRGVIVDRNNVPLAVNRQNFRLVVVAEEAGDVEALLDRVTPVIGLKEEERARVLRDVSRRRSFMATAVKENLTWDQVSWIEVHAPELPGLSIDVGETREYPFGPAAVHTVGYVGAVAESDLTGDPVLGLPGFKIGKSGIEKSYDLTLRGDAGTAQVEVNAFGRAIRELNRDEGAAGAEVRLTLDIELQRYAQQRLATEFSAAAVVMDVDSGDILSMAAHPAYDPNLFATGISSRQWNDLVNDPYGALNNKTITGLYSPGSTMKMVSALAALREGVIGHDHTVFCPGHMDLGNHRFHCWRRGGHGRLDVVGAISQSCDVFFYDVAKRLGIDRLATTARLFGLGEKVGVDLPGERGGLMPTRAWKDAELGQPWQQGESLIAAIGQGYVLATPLQLATMTARLVNGGRAVTPRLVSAIGGTPVAQPSAPLVDVPQTYLATMREAMLSVMTRGTARASQIKTPGMEMGGKTGTSQVRRISMAERAAGVTQDDWPWNQRHHALFVGYAPAAAPRFACSVVVEHGGGGSAVAAPICRDILLETQLRASGGQIASIERPVSDTVQPADDDAGY